MYKVILSDRAVRDLESLPQNYQRLVLNRLTAFTGDPRPRGSKKLHGQTYRVRQGPYRVLYEVHDQAKEIMVLTIKPRREAYR